MSVILAAGGLDDLAMAVGQLVIVGVLMMVGCLIAWSSWKRSVAAAVVACILVLADGAFFRPWTVIAPSNDPYYAFWLFRLRIISAVWVLAVIAAAACLVRAVRRKRKRRP